MLALIGAPSTVTWASGRCQPRGRMQRVAIWSLRAYAFSSVWKVSVRRTACDTAQCPVTTLSQVGERASSKSHMKTDAPLFSALIIIFGSAGPVISTRRSSKSAGAGATVHSPSRLSIGFGRKSGVSPASRRRCRRSRSWSSLVRSLLKDRCSCATKSSASGVRTSSRWGASEVTTTPAGKSFIGRLSGAWRSASKVAASVGRLRACQGCCVTTCSTLARDHVGTISRRGADSSVTESVRPRRCAGHTGCGVALRPLCREPGCARASRSRSSSRERPRGSPAGRRRCWRSRAAFRPG